MTYRIELTPSATRALRKLAIEVRRQVARKIDSLAINPRPASAARLTGEAGLYRIRTGDYRIIYAVHDEVLLVLVVRLGHRRDIYKMLRRR